MVTVDCHFIAGGQSDAETISPVAAAWFRHISGSLILEGSPCAAITHGQVPSRDLGPGTLSADAIAAINDPEASATLVAYAYDVFRPVWGTGTQRRPVNRWI